MPKGTRPGKSEKRNANRIINAAIDTLDLGRQRTDHCPVDWYGSSWDKAKVWRMCWQQLRIRKGEQLPGRDTFKWTFDWVHGTGRGGVMIDSSRQLQTIRPYMQRIWAGIESRSGGVQRQLPGEGRVLGDHKSHWLALKGNGIGKERRDCLAYALEYRISVWHKKPNAPWQLARTTWRLWCPLHIKKPKKKTRGSFFL